jgi:hypothetical protein
MAHYQPPHGGTLGVDASILSIYSLPHLVHFNSFSSLGPRGTGTSKLALHWRQVSSQVNLISRSLFSGITFNSDTTSDFYTYKNSLLDDFNIR